MSSYMKMSTNIFSVNKRFSLSTNPMMPCSLLLAPRFAPPIEVSGVEFYRNMSHGRSLKKPVRQCVREELRRTSSVQGQQGELIQRTMQLIASSAIAVSRDLVERHSSIVSRPSSVVNVKPIATAISSDLQSTTTPGSKRANVNVPEHNFRFKNTKKAAAKMQVIPKTVYLLEEIEQPQD